MRRFSLALVPIVAAAMLVGCEDGPKQVYQPAPPGSGSQWNDGNSTPAVASGGASFGDAFPTTGRTTACSQDVKRARWAWMLQQPIKPPRFYAGIDMAADDLWHGLTIDSAEGEPADPNMPGGGLCNSVPLGFIGGCPSGIGSCNENYWGNNAEVIFTWNIATHYVDQMELQLGYLGTMDFTSADGMHKYSLRIGDTPKKDGQPFLIDWAGGNQDGPITEMFNAAMFTYGALAGLPYDPANASTGCGPDGNCLEYNSQGTWIFGFRPLTTYFEGSVGVPQPAQSTPTLLYNFFSKAEPYSNLPQTVKLDAEGPLATGAPLGARDASVVCTQKIGSVFSDFQNNCITVHDPVGSPGMIDTVNLNKVLYGLSHDFEHWTGNVLGINQNFTNIAVANSDDKVVLDTDKPGPNDIAQDWFFDLRAKGAVRNDYGHYDATTGAQIPLSMPGVDHLDRKASAMVYIEWARLMLEDANKLLIRDGRIKSGPFLTRPTTLGEPACTGYDSTGAPNFAVGCTGLEGLMIPGDTGYGDFSADKTCTTPGMTCLNPVNNWDLFDDFYYTSKTPLRPGDVRAGFCVDTINWMDCVGGDSGGNAPFFDAANWTVRRLGNGVVDHLPTEMQDRRYYYRFFAEAYLKYLKAYSDSKVANVNFWPTGTDGLGPYDVMNQHVDKESLFFDSPNAFADNNFDKFEYIDREYIGKGQVGTPAEQYNYTPYDFEYGVDIIGGNQRYDNYYRRMDREEIAMYGAMLVDKTHTPGQENNVNITNLFGSPVLAAAWPSYACAIGQGGAMSTKACRAFNASSGLPYWANPPLDVTNMPTTATATNTIQITVQTMYNGVHTVYGAPCVAFDSTHPTGCTKPNQACAVGTDYTLHAVGLAGTPVPACVDMVMDLNGPNPPAPGKPTPLLAYYQGAWSRTPFSMGHSPITVHPMDKHPEIGGAKAEIPNYADIDGGPYTNSPMLTTGGDCTKATLGTNADWTADPSGSYCYATLQTGTGLTTTPTFKPMIPWNEMKPGIGFSFPIDGQHDQFVTTAQLDFTGVLETYLIDYQPWVDKAQPSCVSTDTCNTGYTCDPNTKNCVTTDDTIRILAIESQDFLGSVFLCQDPLTGDVLPVHQYESGLKVLDWMAAHPGGWDPISDAYLSSAQAACNVIFRYSPYNNYLDYISSKTNGVKLSITQGSGQGRVDDATLYDPGITQAP